MSYDISCLGEPIRCGIFLDDRYATVDGKLFLYTTGSGNPCILNVYNLTDDCLVTTHEMPGSLHCWSHAVAPDGTLYITPMDQAKLFHYTPSTGAFDDLGTICDQVASYQPQVDEAGRVYIGSYPNGSVIRYDPDTKSFYDYGPAVPGHKYVRSLAYDRGTLYAGTAASGACLVRMDAAAGKREVIPPPKGFDPALFENFYAMTVVDRLLFNYVYYGEKRLLLVYDLDAQQWLDTCVEGFGGLFVSPALYGKAYFCVEGEFWSFDMKTHETANTGIPSPGNGKGFYTVYDPAIGRDVLVTMNHSSDLDLMYVDFATGNVRRTEMRSRLQGGALNLTTLEAGPERSLYMGAYMGGAGSVYAVDTGAFYSFRIDQTEGMVDAGDCMYFGVYPGGRLYRYAGGEATFMRNIGEEQDRPFAMCYADDTLFIGTIPDYNRLGGAVSVYVPATNEFTVYRNIIPQHSITGLAYQNGILYGSTSIWGGLGIEPAATEAQLFLWDTKMRKLLISATPAFDGLDAPVDKIGAVTLGPDGRLWGVGRAGEKQAVLFAANAKTLAIEWQKAFDVVHPISTWRPTPLRFAPDGTLFAGIDGIVMMDIQSRDVSWLTGEPVGQLAFGADGCLYYGTGPALKKIAFR